MSGEENNGTRENNDIARVDVAPSANASEDNLAACSKRRRGRTFDDVWGLFTEAVAPNREQAAVCKQCKEQIVYWRKSERVKSHLL